MAALTGSIQEITYIPARVHDSNKIPTATPTFSESGNTERLMGMLSYIRAGMSLSKDGGH